MSSLVMVLDYQSVGVIVSKVGVGRLIELSNPAERLPDRRIERPGIAIPRAGLTTKPPLPE